jgi:hypothetical protein
MQAAEIGGCCSEAKINKNMRSYLNSKAKGLEAWLKL